MSDALTSVRAFALIYSVQQMCGGMSRGSVPDLSAFERGNYMKVLSSAQHIGLHEQFLPDMYLRRCPGSRMFPLKPRPWPEQAHSLIFLREDLLCHMKSVIRRGNAAINRGLQQNFLNFLARHTVIGSCA
jgi:hypothetical protein